MKIIIRADGGFSCSPFYKLADDHHLKYAVGLPSNEVLKRRLKRATRAVKHLYQSRGEKHQHFISFDYKHINSNQKIKERV